MAIRPRLYGLEDEALDEVYRSGTDAARQQLAGVDVPASDMEFTLEEAEAGLPNVPNVPPAERPDLGTIDPWAGEPRRTPLTATTRTPGFQAAGRFTERSPLSIRSTTPQAPLPDVSPTLLPDEPEPRRFAPTATIGERPQLPTTVRGAPAGTPLLGIDSATAHEEAQTVGLPGIDTPAEPVRKSAPNPYELTADERARLARAERSDRNINIARTIFGGLSGLTQMGLGAAGNVGAASGVGQAMSGYQPMQSAVSDRVSQRIDRDRTQRVQAAQYDQQQRQAAAEAERQATLDALRAQGMQSDIALDQARIAQMQQEQTRQLDEMAANGASADAMRALIRSNVYALPRNNPFAMEWLRAINDPSFAQADVETLRAFDHRIGSMMSTHAFQEGRGISAVSTGGGPYLGNVPGLAGPTTTIRRPPQTIGEMVAQQQAAEQGQAPVPGGVPMPGPTAMPPAPAPARGAGGVARAARPAAPTAQPPTAPTSAALGALPDLSQYGVQATNQSEYVAALAALERSGRRFTDEEIRANPRVQLALATQILAMRERNAGRRADLQRNAEDIMRTAAGEQISPDEQQLYARVSERANAVHNEVVTMFSAPLRALSRALEVRDQHPRGSAEYIRLDGMIRAAIVGNGSVRSLAPLASLGSVMNRMEEDFGRERSGAAISATEWVNFRNILNTEAFFTDPEVTLRGLRALYDRAINVRNSRFSEGTRPEQAIRFRDNWFATRRALAGGGR